MIFATVMDTEFARTFLAVVETGSFVRAAERVHLTQSTVSARIKNLEDQIGKPLFERHKNGVSLTAEGIKFQRHASALVRVWEQARSELSLPLNYQSIMTIGSQYSIWDNFLLSWLSQVRQAEPQVALRSVVGLSDTLMTWLIDGSIDMAIMYRPERRSGFEVELLFEDRLVLVSSVKSNDEMKSENYVYVDWGPQFGEDHALHFPHLSPPGLLMDIGSLALKYVVSTPSFGYFPERTIRHLGKRAGVTFIPSAPVFSYPVYAVYPSNRQASLLAKTIESLKQFSSAESPS